MLSRISTGLLLCLPLLASISLPAVAAPRRDFSSEGYVTKPTKLWTEPTKFGVPIARLEPGLDFDVLTYSTSRAWVKVRTPSGREGWIPARFTSFTGSQIEEGSAVAENGAGGRGLASEGQAVPVEAGKPVDPKAAEPKKWGRAGLHYANELSRDKASGFGLNLGALLFPISPRFGVGFGLDFQLFRASDTAGTTSVSRSSMEFVPNVFGTFRSNSFSVDMGLGLQIDKTSIETTQSGVIDPAFTGSDTSMLLAIKLAPGFSFDVGQKSRLTLQLQYKALVDLSSGSAFATTDPAPKLQHVIGLGAAFDFDL